MRPADSSRYGYTTIAKVAATVDVISGGRVEMGIGAGWCEHAWRAFGYGFPSAGQRIGMLDEGVQIMRQMWIQGTATLAGSHYQVDGAIGRPLPLQAGGIPLGIAGAGERNTLRIAAHTLTTPTLTRRRRPSPTSRRCSPGTAANPWSALPSRSWRSCLRPGIWG